jgi:hypothetical protein
MRARCVTVARIFLSMKTEMLTLICGLVLGLLAGVFGGYHWGRHSAVSDALTPTPEQMAEINRIDRKIKKEIEWFEGQERELRKKHPALNKFLDGPP